MIIGILTTGVISPKVGPYYYVGCYGDQGSQRAFYTQVSDQSSIVGCANQAKANNFQYFGLQDYRSTNGRSQCFLSNDLAAAIRYGPTATCVAVNITNTLYQHGLGWTNAVYSFQPISPSGMLITYKSFDDIHYF